MSRLYDIIQKIFLRKKRKAKEENLILMLVNIRNYVGIAEYLTSEKLVEFLNSYIDECYTAINRYGGLTVRVNTDRILAVWFEGNREAGLECERCCQGAKCIAEKISETDTEPDFSIIISVCRGNCIYVVEDGEVTELFGDVISRVEKINRVYSNLKNLKNIILVDNSVTSVCPYYKYEQITDEVSRIL